VSFVSQETVAEPQSKDLRGLPHAGTNTEASRRERLACPASLKGNFLHCDHPLQENEVLRLRSDRPCLRKKAFSSLAQDDGRFLFCAAKKVRDRQRARRPAVDGYHGRRASARATVIDRRYNCTLGRGVLVVQKVQG
jgi:hypothetical protein